MLDAQCVSDESSSGFCRVTFALVIGSDAIGNFNHAVTIRRAFETALPHRDAGVQLHHGEAMHPGIRRVRCMKTTQPICGKLRFVGSVHGFDAGAYFLGGFEDELQPRSLQTCAVQLADVFVSVRSSSDPRTRATSPADTLEA